MEIVTRLMDANFPGHLYKKGMIPQTFQFQGKNRKIEKKNLQDCKSAKHLSFFLRENATCFRLTCFLLMITLLRGQMAVTY